MIFAHGGDTLSPSLMSGIDGGAHIIALTNMVPPDIFAPGNHEFDFGKAVFFKRMAEAKFPVYAANLRGADGKPLANIKDRSIVDAGGVRIGLTGAAYDQTPKVSSSEDLKFLPTVTAMKEQGAALRQEGADFVVAVMHADRSQAVELSATNAADLILTGHNHDLFVQYDGRVAMAESSYDGHYVTIIDVAIDVAMVEGRRTVKWWPQFRIVDTATVTPDSEVAAAVAKLEAELSREMDQPLAKLAVELDSRNIAVRTGEAAIGNLIADAMRAKSGADAAVTNGGGIRGGRVYPAGSTITRRDVLAELPFGNRVVTIEIRGRDLRSALENGFSRLADAAGRFPQVSGHDDPVRSASAGRQAHRVDQDRRRAAQSQSRLSHRDQRFPGPRQRRLRHLRQGPVAIARRRLAAAGERSDVLPAKARHRADRRPGPHRRRAEMKTPPLERGGVADLSRNDQRASRSSSPATPAATPRPVCPCKLSGCSEMVLFDPPTRTLAPAPTTAVALADAPP